MNRGIVWAVAANELKQVVRSRDYLLPLGALGLLFFFFVVAVFAAAKRKNLHPLNYFFFGCAFFAPGSPTRMARVKTPPGMCSGARIGMSSAWVKASDASTFVIKPSSCMRLST